MNIIQCLTPANYNKTINLALKEIFGEQNTNFANSPIFGNSSLSSQVGNMSKGGHCELGYATVAGIHTRVGIS